VEPPKVVVIKRSGDLEEYKQEKMSRGITLAFEKRPITQSQIEAIIDDIEHSITKLRSRQITSRQIGEIVISKLKEVDEVAYLRFLSVYKSFGSAMKFQREAEKLTKK